MAKNIEPKLRKIGDYLKLEDDTVFNIPEYQRAYSWKTENCDKLWQDIIDYVAGDRKDRYFFGTIIINCQDNDTRLDLIDGQQRTTTFLLLLKALLVRINVAIGKTEGDPDSEGLCRGLKERRRRIMGILYQVGSEDISDNPDQKIDAQICGNTLILENNSINERFPDELKTILQAVDFVEAETNSEKIPYKQKDNKYTNFFRNFKYFYEMVGTLSTSELNRIAKAIIDDCEVIEIKSWQVAQAITMFNSLNSDGLPLYDADIISAKLYAESEKQENGKEFTRKWKELLDIISELKANGVANIDSILMQKMYYERAKNKEILSESGAINVTTPGLRRYYTEINKDILEHPIALCDEMINLAKIWKRVSTYSIVQIMYKFNENSKLFLASYFCRYKEENITENIVKTIVECMLRLFAIMELVDTGYSSSSFKTFLFGENVKLVDTAMSVDSVKEDFNRHIRDKWSREVIEAEILDYDRNSLVFLNEYLFAREKGISFQLGSKCDIEHIMPCSGNNLQEIRKDAGILDEEEFRQIVNKLGNKILLEEKINRAIGNEWFRTKVSTKLENKTGYVDSNYPIASHLVSAYGDKTKPYWKKTDISDATNKACNRILKFIFDEK